MSSEKKRASKKKKPPKKKPAAKRKASPAAAKKKRKPRARPKKDGGAHHLNGHAPAESYESKLARDNARASAKSTKGRDVAEGFSPGPADAKRRAACEFNLQLYLETYHPRVFRLAWGADHLVAIQTIQTCVLRGGLFALALQRGGGKTAVTERAALWSLLYRHRRFVALIGSNQARAEEALDRLKAEFISNDLLLADFAHAVHCFRRLERNARRATGQLFEGKPTNPEWSAARLTFPTMPDHPDPAIKNVSGSTIQVVGLGAAVRGLSHTLPSGELIRPDLVLGDDLQTRESAISQLQTAERLAILNGDVLNLAGPDTVIAAVLTVTVIKPGDLADQLVNPALNPQWSGRRFKAVPQWPTGPDSERLWIRYRELRAEGLRQGDGGKVATEFYVANRAAMDQGAIVAWPARMADAVSALQRLEDIRLDIGEEAFASEFMNDPLKPDSEALPMLSAAQIAEKTNGLARGQAPLWTSHITLFVDVHDSLLVYAACGWADDFTGAILSYGTYPAQQGMTWSLRKANPTLADVAPAGSGREAAIHSGLEVLCDGLLGGEWSREGGTVMKVERCLVDSGFSPDLVYNFCRTSKHAAVLLPSRGLGIGANKAPLAEWTLKEGERRGWYWVIAPTLSRTNRVVRFDANHWKTFAHDRLSVPKGDRGGLTLHGQTPEIHRLIAEHLVSEAPVLATAAGRTVKEWRVRQGFSENHFLDSVVGNAVAASISGCVLPNSGAMPKPAPRPRMSLPAMRDAAEAKRRGY
jgi:hypothetical protein